MRRSLRPRSNLFRALLTLALLAWASLAFATFAPGGPMDDAAMASMNIAQISSHAGCNGMSADHAQHAPAPHKSNSGHACCHDGGCYCASLCSGVAGVDSPSLAWIPPLAEPQAGFAPVAFSAHSAPPLRPPIA